MCNTERLKFCISIHCFSIMLIAAAIVHGTMAMFITTMIMTILIAVMIIDINMLRLFVHYRGRYH